MCNWPDGNCNEESLNSYFKLYNDQKKKKKKTSFLTPLKPSRFPDLQINLWCDWWEAFMLSKLKICHRPAPSMNKTAQWLIGSYLDAIVHALCLSPWKLALSADTIEQLCYLSIDLHSSRGLDPRGGCHLCTKATQEKTWGGEQRRGISRSSPLKKTTCISSWQAKLLNAWRQSCSAEKVAVTTADVVANFDSVLCVWHFANL